MGMLKRFWNNRSGGYAIMTAVMAVPLLLGVGISVDYAMALRARAHMQSLADGASLALANSRETDKTKLRDLAERYVMGNLQPEVFDKIAVSDVQGDKEKVTVGISGKVGTYFMGMANLPELNVSALAVAIRAVSGSVEVSLVLDNTDSMNLDGKIGTLKTAASNLAKELFTNKDAKVRVALVPYAEQINVGMQNRNASWLSVPEDYSVTKPAAACYMVSTKQGACLETSPVVTCMVDKDGVLVPSTCGGSCTRRAPDVPITPYEVCPKPTTTSYKWYGCVGSRVSAGKLLLDDSLPGIPYPGYVATSQKCLTEILPLTSDESTVQKAISGMITSRSGYTPQTYIPGGLTWGINTLSPTLPYDQGEPYDPANGKPRKVIVLMTDGLNTRRVNVTGTLNLDYLKGGALIGDTNTASAAQRLATNADTVALCDYAKAKRIEIFTVAFKVEDANAKAMLQACASAPLAEHYYDATDSNALITAFAGISQSLTRVRLAQ